MRDLESRATAVADLMAIVGYISDDNPDDTQVSQENMEVKVCRLRRAGWYYAETRRTIC